MEKFNELSSEERRLHALDRALAPYQNSLMINDKAADVNAERVSEAVVRCAIRYEHYLRTGQLKNSI